MRALNWNEPRLKNRCDSTYIALKGSQKRKRALVGARIVLIPKGIMAERTGLEPATPGVTGRYSNRLNYRSLKRFPRWWVVTGSNRRPPACKAGALPAELTTPRGTPALY